MLLLIFGLKIKFPDLWIIAGKRMSSVYDIFLVLSAGYDGDDNDDDNIHQNVPDLFGDQPLKPPDVLMHGMSTPPSTLTIDDSEATYAR